MAPQGIGFRRRARTLSGSAVQEWWRVLEQRGRRLDARARAAERDGIGPDGWRGVPLSAAAAAFMIVERARATVHEEVTTDDGDKGGGEEQPHARLELRVDHEAVRLATDERREVAR